MHKNAQFSKLTKKIIVIVHRENSQNLSKGFLRRVWERSELNWKNGSQILPLDFPEDNGLRKAYSKLILRKTPRQMKEHYVKVKIKATTKLPQPKIVKSAGEAIKVVSSDRNAVGYIRLVDRHRADGVKIALELE